MNHNHDTDSQKAARPDWPAFSIFSGRSRGTPGVKIGWVGRLRRIEPCIRFCRRSVVAAVALCSVGGIVRAEPTRTEVVKATTPADDAKPNSDQVPEVYALEGQFERVLILRFKYETDLLAGLEQMVKEHRVRNAVILSGIGSLRGYHVHSVSNRTFPSKNVFIRDPIAPADLTSMNGYVIDGRIHAHVTLADSGKAFGGHLERGTPVFTFAIVTLGVLRDGVDLSRVDDKTYR